MKMKTLTSKIFLIAFIILTCISGCKKAEDPKTTYQVVNNLESLSSSLITYLSENDPNIIPYLDGTLREVIVYCYIGSDIVRTDNLGNISPKGGESDIKEVDSGFDKIKVTFIFTTAQSIYYGLAINRFHLITTTILEKGKNNIVSISTGVQISNSTVQ